MPAILDPDEIYQSSGGNLPAGTIILNDQGTQYGTVGGQVLGNVQDYNIGLPPTYDPFSNTINPLTGQKVLDPNAPSTQALLASLNPSGNVFLGVGGNAVMYPEKVAPTIDEWLESLKNSPQYKAAMEAIDQQERDARDEIEWRRQWAKRDYEFAKQQLSSGGGGGGDPTAAQQAALDQLARDKAAHDKALAEKATREILASRGMGSSGQTTFEQQELQYNYDMLIKEINLRAQARAAAAAAASSSSSRAISDALARLDYEYEKEMAGLNRAEEKIPSQVAAARGQALNGVANQLREFYWDGSEYIGPTQERISPGAATQLMQYGDSFIGIKY